MIEELLRKALAERGESAIVAMFRVAAMQSAHVAEDRIPFDPETDSVVYEMPFRFGRADIIIFHADGWASVIEVKDGDKGYTHVVGGIGQAGLYAAQLGMARGGLIGVRRCLLWTSVGQTSADALIEVACEQAGVVPLPWGSLANHLREMAAVLGPAG